MKKRNHGEGTLSKGRNKNGGAIGYKGAVVVGFKLDGKPDRRWVSGKTPDEVRRKLEDLKTARNSGTVWSSERLSIGEYLTKWIEHKKMDGTRPKTISRYEQVVVKQLTPTLGRLRLEKLSPLDVEGALQAIRTGSTAKAARRARGTLSMALNQAVRWRIVAFNVCQGVKLPAIPDTEESEARFWSPEDVVLFLEQARPHRLYALFHVGVMTGMRPCELLGLRWQDVDFEAGLLRIEQDAVYIDGKMHLGPVKTKASRRTVTIPADTVFELRAHLERQHSEQNLLENPSGKWQKCLSISRAERVTKSDVSDEFGTNWSEAEIGEELRPHGTSPDALRMRQRRRTPERQYKGGGLVFADELGGVTNYNNLYHVLKALILKAGVTRIGVHGMRHTHASILIRHGVNLKVVSDRLGHKDVAFTLQIYAHLFEDQRREAAIGIDEFLGKTIPPLEVNDDAPPTAVINPTQILN